jgi:hypothetical protein
VFSVDPGVTTGWAYIKDADVATLPQGECDLDMVCGQFGGDENQQAIDLFKLITFGWPCCVVVEDFIPQALNKERHFLSPIRVTAKLELLLWQSDRRYIKQMPSLAKGTITDEYMRSAMMWSPGQPHANDAVRHGLTFLRRVVRSPHMVEALLKPLGIDVL